MPAPADPDPREGTTPADADASPPDAPRPLTLSVPDTSAGVLTGLLIIAASAVLGMVVPGQHRDAPTVETTSVAVLPFRSSGSADAMWREGMVTALSTALDGAGGLRAIPDRTVLAVWDRIGRAGEGAGSDEALAVAREVGARYAVVGSALGLRSELRFSARVLRTDSGDQLGRVDVRGPPDSAIAMTDELTGRLIGLIEAQADDAVRRADVASLTARSVDALEAYLEGEEHLWAGRAETAMDAFQAAIRADSSFALPYARIGLYGLWRHEGTGWATRRAYELSDQLPRRDRRLIRALHMGRIEHRTLAAADSFRALGREYPSDPSVWSSLGEFVFHAEIPRGLPEIEEVHERAVALEPAHTAYYDHYVGPAFTLHNDSALAARRVEAMPDGERKRMYRLGLDLAFGREETRRRALADLERLQLGRTLPSCLFAHARTLGYPIPDSVAREFLRPESLPADASPGRLRCAALHAIERGRADLLPSLVERIRSSVDTTAGNGVTGGQLQAIFEELRGYRALVEGDLERATRLMSRSNESGAAGAIWRGDLHRDLGRLDRAEGWYRAAWRHPLSYERLGRLYERTGEREEAVTAYRRFIAAWSEADEPLRGLVRTARRRVRALTDME